MRVSFRATFAGPKGKLNPLGCRIVDPQPQIIEIARKRDAWIISDITRITTGRRNPLSQLGEQKTHGCAKDAVSEAFRLQLSPWELWDSKGPLDPDSVEEDPEGNFKRKVLMHIAAADQIGQPGNYFKTECGIVVGAHEIRSKRGQEAPSCKACRPAWEAFRKEPRI